MGETRVIIPSNLPFVPDTTRPPLSPRKTEPDVCSIIGLDIKGVTLETVPTDTVADKSDFGSNNA